MCNFNYFKAMLQTEITAISFNNSHKRTQTTQIKIDLLHFLVAFSA